jgi:hypothetical protein
MPKFETPDPISAAVDLITGDVRISAGDTTTTVVEVRPSDPSDEQDVRAADTTHVECAKGRLVVKGPRTRSWLPRRGGGSIDVTIEMPAGSHLEGTGHSADFTCDGRIGDCRIKTGRGQLRIGQAATVSVKSAMGDVTVDHATGDVEVSLASGDVRLGEVDGAVVVKNANGDTWVGSVRRDVRVSGANGDIAVDVADAGVGAKTANGAIRVSDVARGSVVLQTHSGDVEVGIREGSAAWLDVNATAGNILNELAAVAAPEPAAATVEVRARTTVGDVLIRRP